MQMSIADYLNNQKEEKNLFESIYREDKKETTKEDVSVKKSESTSVTDDELMFEAISQAANTHQRALAMSAVIAWNNDYDPTADDLDMAAQGVADIDEDGDITSSEEDDYNETLFLMGQAMVFLGVSEDCAYKAVQGDDDAAADAYSIVANTLENSEKSEDEQIAEFSVTTQSMNESVYKVFRNGKSTWKKRPLKKRRMNAAQKAALKRARAKANTSAAKAKRAKSMRKRKAAGM